MIHQSSKCWRRRRRRRRPAVWASRFALKPSIGSPSGGPTTRGHRPAFGSRIGPAGLRREPEGLASPPTPTLPSLELRIQTSDARIAERFPFWNEVRTDANNPSSPLDSFSPRFSTCPFSHGFRFQDPVLSPSTSDSSGSLTTFDLERLAHFLCKASYFELRRCQMDIRTQC